MGYYLASTGAVHYFMENALGSTTAVSDETLARTDWYMYDGYGVTDVLRQGEYTPFKYVGKHGYYSDGDSGLILLGHRYYMPDLGKFLTQDPLGHAAGLNLYQYASQNPLRNIDPTGLDEIDDMIRRNTQVIFTSAGFLGGGFLGGAGGGSVSGGALAAPGAAEGAMIGAAIMTPVGQIAGEAIVGLRHAINDYWFSSSGGSSSGTSSPGPSLPRFAPGRWTDHFQKHMSEFPELKSAVDYLFRARDIIAGRISGFASHVTRSGNTLMYNSTTNEFLSYRGNLIRTLFKPRDGIRYWQQQLLK